MKIFRSEFFNYIKKIRFFRLMAIIAIVGVIAYWLWVTGAIIVSLESYDPEYDEKTSIWMIVFVMLYVFFAPLFVSLVFLTLVAGILWALNPDWRIKQQTGMDGE